MTRFVRIARHAWELVATIHHLARWGAPKPVDVWPKGWWAS